MNRGTQTERKVFSYMEEHHMLQAGDRLVAGISGGADSVCLLFLLLEYRKQVPFELAVVHVNHGIRAEAGEDAAFVEQLCREWEIPFYLRQADVKGLVAQEKCSEEDAGRRLRYEIFEAVAGEFGATRIAVAHNSNDRAETMLFHLFRGCGVGGLQGILPVRGKVIRPILCLERMEIEDYLREKGIGWCEDCTNQEDDYARNRIRHHILPYAEREIFPGTVEHMCRTADFMAETESYLAERTAEAMDQCVLAWQWTTEVMEQYVLERQQPSGTENTCRVELSVESFVAQPELLQKRMLLQLAEELSPTGKDIEAVHIRDVLTLFSEEGNRRLDLPKGILARREYKKVILERVEKSVSLETVLPTPVFSIFFLEKGQEVPRNQYTKWFDYDKMKESPIVRFRETGDFLTISDGRGQMIHKSLKEYMIAEKIPQHMRDKIPVLAEGNHILWLMGYRISEYYKVDRNTKRVLQVKLERDCVDSETEEKNGRTH